MKVLKFGGKSLANGLGITTAFSIIRNKIQQKDPIVIVVSARGQATDQLEKILEKSVRGESYQNDFQEFKKYQQGGFSADISQEFSVFIQQIRQWFPMLVLFGNFLMKKLMNWLILGLLFYTQKRLFRLLRRKFRFVF